MENQKSHQPENLAAPRWVAPACYHILNQKLLVRSTSQSFRDQVCRLMRSFPSSSGSDESALILSFIETLPVENSHCRSTHVWRDDQQIGIAEEAWQLFRLMEWQLDIFLADNVQHSFLLHAGAVTTDGQGLILPGVSGNGKSSLTMALLLQGFQYLSDELAVIDPATADLWAFPKPFSLKDPSLFPNLATRPEVWLGPEAGMAHSPVKNEGYDRPVWYIHPEDVRPGAIASGPVPVRYIFFPKFDPEAAPQLQPLTPNQAMRKLLENSVNFSQLDQGGLQLLARLAREAQSFTVIVNGPQLTAQLIQDAL